MQNADESIVPLNVSVNSMLDLVTRIDERVLYLKKSQLDLDRKINENSSAISEIKGKVEILESQSHYPPGASQSEVEDIKALEIDFHNMNLRLQTLENSNNKQELRWKNIFTFGIQLVWVILAAYLLYKLGIQSPQVP